MQRHHAGVAAAAAAAAAGGAGPNVSVMEDDTIEAPQGLECPICLDAFETPVMTPCHHWFCKVGAVGAVRWVSVIVCFGWCVCYIVVQVFPRCGCAWEYVVAHAGLGDLAVKTACMVTNHDSAKHSRALAVLLVWLVLYGVATYCGVRTLHCIHTDACVCALLRWLCRSASWVCSAATRTARCAGASWMQLACEHLARTTRQHQVGIHGLSTGSRFSQLVQSLQRPSSNKQRCLWLAALSHSVSQCMVPVASCVCSLKLLLQLRSLS